MLLLTWNDYPAKDGELIQKQPLCNQGDKICHPKSSLLNRTFARGCNNNAPMQKKYFDVSYRRRIPGTFPWQWPGIGDTCQSGKMVTLLNSLFFVLNISFLPNYTIKYYDYIEKWCSGVQHLKSILRYIQWDTIWSLCQMSIHWIRYTHIKPIHELPLVCINRRLTVIVIP